MLLNVSRALSLMEERGVDALIASSRENVIYLTGSSLRQGSGGGGQMYTCLPQDGQENAFAVVPAVFFPAVMEQEPAIKDVRVYSCFPLRSPQKGPAGEVDEPLKEALEKAEAYPDALAGLIAGLRDHGLWGARMGLDEKEITHQQWMAIDEALPSAQLEPAYEIFRQIRAVKTEEEIKRLTQAAKIAEGAMAKAMKLVEPGVTTWDLLCEYLAEAGRRGASGGAATILAGPRGALFFGPPASMLFKPSRRPIERGEVIKFDVGCSWEEYWADTARTVVMGEPSNTLEDRFQLVHDAHMEAMEFCKPGVRASELFEVTMAVVRKGGIEDFERSHCGHGIGLQGHELPSIVPSPSGENTVLEPGMVICLENTLSEIGLGTLSVEDTVVVTETGCESLTIYTRHMRRLGGW